MISKLALALKISAKCPRYLGYSNLSLLRARPLITKSLFTYSYTFNFSTNKKSKNSKQQKSYNLEGMDESKVPDHLKKIYQIKKQTTNLQVASEAQLQEQSIIAQIKRQRNQLQSDQQESKSKTPDDQEEQIQNYAFIQKFLIGLTGINVGIAGLLSFPIIPNSLYWLGVYSSTLLYPSFIVTTSVAIGINLAYLILRQSLRTDKKIQDLKNIDVTSSSFKHYIEIIFLSLQFFSLAGSMSIPLTLFGIDANYRNVFLYAGLFAILSINAHNSYQLQDIKNNKFRISTQSACFIILFLLSSYIHLRYVVSKDEKVEETQQQIQRKIKFRQGQDRFKNIWKINRTFVIKDEKITDLLTKQTTQQQKYKQDQSKNNQTLKQQNKNKNKIW